MGAFLWSVSTVWTVRVCEEGGGGSKRVVHIGQGNTAVF